MWLWEIIAAVEQQDPEGLAVMLAGANSRRRSENGRSPSPSSAG
jgi:hypothetical protein